MILYSHDHMVNIQGGKAYCKELITIIENKPQIAHLPAVKEKLDVLKEAVEDTQEHLNYSTDTDARVGHKTADSSFFGYKTHLAISNERIITAAVVTTGEKSDGHYLQELIEKSKVTGMEVETVITDTAYSGKNNLLYTKEQSIQRISKLNPMITQNGRANGKGFDFNKDAGLFGMQIQGATTIFAVNLKRILKLLNEKG